MQPVSGVIKAAIRSGDQKRNQEGDATNLGDENQEERARKYSPADDRQKDNLGINISTKRGGYK